MTTSRDRWGFNNCDYMFTAIENPFPLNQECYVGGKWWLWVERILRGQQAEQELIRSITQSMPREDAELYADDYYEAEDISNYMFAAFTVAITAQIEHFYYRCMKLCECAGKETVDTGSVFRHEYIKRYFKDNINLNIEVIIHSDEVLGVRGLQNIYKHNNGIFLSKKNKLIKPALVTEWNLVDKSEIVFSDINFEDVLIAAGMHCNAFLQEIWRTLLTNPTTK